MRKLIISLSLLAAALLPVGCRHENSGPDVSEFAIRGIDVSNHNGAIDFNAVAADSIQFVFIKASEGTDWKARSLTRNYARARRAGLKVGLYHFFRFTSPGHLQALNIADAAKNRPLDFPLVIDVEPYHDSDGAIPSRIVVSRLDSCISSLQAMGHDVIIYCNRHDYNQYIKGHFDSIPLWISSLDSRSPDDIDWVIWQHKHQGRVAGINGMVDLNVFHGDSAAFAAFTAR